VSCEIYKNISDKRDIIVQTLTDAYDRIILSVGVSNYRYVSASGQPELYQILEILVYHGPGI
jgi:hypothetical protein